MSVEIRLELEDSRDSEGARGGFYWNRLKYDGAHQKHEMWIDHSPYDDETVFRYTLKTAAGALQEDRSLLLPVDAGGRRREKFDDLGPPIVVVPLGETVGSWVVPCDWHGPLRWQNNQPVGRKTRRGFIVIPGVYIPHAAGQDPDEVFGVAIPVGNGGGGEPVDYEQLRAIIREVLGIPEGRTLALEWGVDPARNIGWREVLEGQATDALREAFKGGGLFYQGDGVFARLDEAFFHTLTKNWPDRFPHPQKPLGAPSSEGVESGEGQPDKE